MEGGGKGRRMGREEEEGEGKKKEKDWVSYSAYHILLKWLNYFGFAYLSTLSLWFYIDTSFIPICNHFYFEKLRPHKILHMIYFVGWWR